MQKYTKEKLAADMVTPTANSQDFFDIQVLLQFQTAILLAFSCTCQKQVLQYRHFAPETKLQGKENCLPCVMAYPIQAAIPKDGCINPIEIIHLQFLQLHTTTFSQVTITDNCSAVPKAQAAIPLALLIRA